MTFLPCSSCGRNGVDVVVSTAGRCSTCTKLARYSLQYADFMQMLKEQGGRCKICNWYMKKPCVDHDHETEKVRGLLCGTCNAGLGFFRDSVRNLANAIVYLEENGKTFS